MSRAAAGPRRLSKSKLLSHHQCPKRLYYEVHHREYATPDAGREQLFAAGHQVGDIACALVPDGVLVGFEDGLQAAIAKTRRLLHDPSCPPIFEATFQHDGVLVRVDVLHPEPDGLRIVEVKAATRVKDHHRLDCAIQLWVVEGCGYHVNRVELAHVDNGFVYAGDGHHDGLFRHQDVTAEVRARLPEVPGQVRQAQAVLAGPEPDIEAGKQCTKPYRCAFLPHCRRDWPEHHVRQLPGRSPLPETLWNEGIRDLRDVPPGRLSDPIHQRMLSAVLSGREYLDRDAAAAELAGLGYPRYYIDFETVSVPVPLWAHTRPYEPVPFQWSCHIERSPGELEHREHLDTSGGAPMRPFIESLLDAVGGAGPVIVYTGYEARILRACAARFPDLAYRIQALIERLYDLHRLVRRHYYHPDLHGSFSLKQVAPAMSPSVRYDELGGVRTGDDASAAYLAAIHPDTPPDTRTRLHADLLRYCALDTLAMVRMVQRMAG